MVGRRMFPIQHLAVAGKYRVPRGRSYRVRSSAEVEAERFLPSIITTASPSLLTLTIIGVDSYREVEVVGNRQSYCKKWVSDMVKFPQLRELVALDQQLIRLDFDKSRDNTVNISKYPNLHKLYILNNYSLEGLPSLLPNLRHLRLDMLDSTNARLPSLDKTLRAQSLIIDAPQYRDLIINGCLVTHQSKVDYGCTIDKYLKFIKVACDPGNSGVIIPAVGHTGCTSHRRILAAWANAVAGGVGCWTTTWTPTVLKTGCHIDD